MVDEAVDHRGCDDVVGEDFAPAAEGLVGGDDQRGPFIAAGDQLEEEVGGLLADHATTRSISMRSLSGAVLASPRY